ncbi:MAG TPA: glycosyltransferase [Chitinophagaceae bacterium]
MKKRIVFVITNDLKYDQRMQRICNSLQANGYDVTLIGTDIRNNKKPSKTSYRQIQLHAVFKKGKLFYAEFNLKAFIRLMILPFDAVCAVDLDSIMPCLWASRLRNKKRGYDAHELFCELPEIINRPRIYRTWKKIEQHSLPYFTDGYSVSESISAEYNRMYGHDYATIRNIGLLNEQPPADSPISKPYILYQGALNEGRGIEFLLPAMAGVDLPLVICGEGNFSAQARKIVNELKLHDKVLFQGMIEPHLLPAYTFHARVGINLGDGTGLNNYLSLNNKFFDYIHAALPQVVMDFPEFRKFNDEFEVAVLIPDLRTESISKAINRLLMDSELYNRLKVNCKHASVVVNWQQEEKKLLDFYKNLFNTH